MKGGDEVVMPRRGSGANGAKESETFRFDIKILQVNNNFLHCHERIGPND